MTFVVPSEAELVVPQSVRHKAGIKADETIEFIPSAGTITILVKEGDDEYTPAQRRAIDAQLKKSEQDFKNGRSFGPFNSAEEMIAHMKAQLKRAAAKKAKRSR